MMMLTTVRRTYWRYPVTIPYLTLMSILIVVLILL